MGLILDLAVIGVTIVVIGSLALLAWTLGVGASRAAGDARARVARIRATAARAEARIGQQAYDDTGDAASE